MGFRSPRGAKNAPAYGSNYTPFTIPNAIEPKTVAAGGARRGSPRPRSACTAGRGDTERQDPSHSLIFNYSDALKLYTGTILSSILAVGPICDTIASMGLYAMGDSSMVSRLTQLL